MIVRQLRRDFDREVASLGITGSQGTLLFAVATAPGATQRGIADMLEMTEAAAGRLIDRMVAEELLERRPKPDDRRAHCIYLTGRAQAVLEALSAMGDHHEERLLAGLGEAERDELLRLLDHVAGNLQA
ncbi:MarR family winged helix-turn-helix transcriptional regulator [Novosphingobium piscinae]|nr:MarR family transcriptional regulator [Novosphingobium piscinae]